jgi:hypothetical protein
MSEQKQNIKVDPKSPPPDFFKLIYPTLYIGIGGTGKEIMLRLRRRILQNLWNGRRIESMADFPVASFLYFDTFMGKAEDDKRKGDKGSQKDPLLPLIELPKDDCFQDKFDTDKYLMGDELDRYHSIKEWLPIKDLKNFKIDPSKGAAQVRPVSRLYFFDKVNQLIPIINNKARILLQNLGNERLSRLGLETEPDVKVIVLCSIAGGTGSGAFLDMGYLCKSLQNPKPKEVNLYAVTGGAFGNLHKRVLANSYAAMSELEYCISANHKDSYVSSWSKGLSNRASTPYDNIYVIDNVNIVRQSTGNRNHLFEMVADVLFEELHDQSLRGKRAEDLVNQEQHKMPPFLPPPMPAELGECSQRFSRAYSSLGQVTLYTQGRIEFEIKTAEVARDMIKAFFLLSEEEKANNPTAQEVDEFLREHMRLERGFFRIFLISCRAQKILLLYITPWWMTFLGRVILG